MSFRNSLLASTAVALLLCATSASGQEQKKGMDGAPSGQPGANATGGEQRVQQKDQGGTTKSAQPSEKGSEKNSKGTAQGEAKGKGTAQGEMKGQPGKATGQAEPNDKSKGTAQTQPQDKGAKPGTQAQQPKEQGSKGSAQTQPSKEQGSKGAAQRLDPSKQQGTDTSKSEAAKGTDPAKSPATANRIQLSEQQRTNLHSTLLKQSNVNRITNVNFSVNVGTRVPRSVRLVALPAEVISIVPQYRSYRYFVVNDEICIVDPNSYEIVDVIPVSGRTAGIDNRGGIASLVLTEEEKATILSEIDMRSDSTLGLGALAEGADVPRGVQLRAFPDAVVQKVPKVKGYKYFTAENRVAIADTQGSKVQLVIEQHR
jgi:hypothetical protein